ncbi:DNA damage-regulated autophagy modulator protein 1-like isoform X2 [Ornithodoros turicata]|uniref:DNA damage-regulated autophagy modulator protein 1-like isoform X2 n=1 Tax=Ornithodoros turicata TaxID=34597 RepID=UPI003138E9B4
MVKLVGVSWLPIAFGLTLSGGSLLTMMWAVLRGDVTPYLPFVSDAGTDPPQSGFFSICLYITSVLGLLCVLVRFLTIRSFNGHFSRKLDALNTVAAIIAVLAFFGMAAVAAFPTSLVPPAHAVAANLLFFGIICYEALQTVMSFSMCPNFNGRLIATIRLGITVYSICGVIISILLTELYLTRGKMRMYVNKVQIMSAASRAKVFSKFLSEAAMTPCHNKTTNRKTDAPLVHCWAAQHCTSRTPRAHKEDLSSILTTLKCWSIPTIRTPFPMAQEFFSFHIQM